MNLNIPALMSSADRWETAGYVASAIVMLGIVIESIELFKHGFTSLSRERRLEIAGLLLVVLGLAAEVLTQVQSNNSTGLVIAALVGEAKDSEGKIAELKMQTASAVASAATLGVSFGNLDQFVKDKTKEFNAATDELKRGTNALNKARDDALAAAQETEKDLAAIDTKLKVLQDMEQKVRDISTSRILTDAQIFSIAEKLKMYAKTPFALCAAEDTDAEFLVAQVGAVLEKAGWIWKPSANINNGLTIKITGKPHVCILPARGISISFAESRKTKFVAASLMLANELNAAGIKADTQFNPDNIIRPEFDRDTLYIIVGTR